MDGLPDIGDQVGAPFETDLVEFIGKGVILTGRSRIRQRLRCRTCVSSRWIGKQNMGCHHGPDPFQQIIARRKLRRRETGRHPF